MYNGKKSLSLLLCLILLLHLLSITAFAEGESVLSVSSAEGLRGDTVTVDVKLSAVNGIASGNFTIGYDNARLTLQSIQAGAALNGATIYPNANYTSNSLRVSFAKTTPLESSGVLVTLTFKIKDTASLGDGILTILNAKLMDKNADTVSRTLSEGKISVLGASISLSSAQISPGECANLVLSLNAPVSVCGGEITLSYDSGSLTCGRIIGADKLGSVPITVSSSVKGGEIKISWMSTSPNDGFGPICTIPLTADKGVTGTKTIRFQSLKFYDINGKEVAHQTPQTASVLIDAPSALLPELSFKNGSSDVGGHTVTIQAVLNGASVVCGGNAQINYDKTCCELISMEPVCPGLVISPSAVENVDGSLKLAWANATAPTGEQILVNLTFRVKENTVSAVTFSNISLRDWNGNSIGSFSSKDTQITIMSNLLVNEVTRTEKNCTLNLKLVSKIPDAMIMAAAYSETGKLETIHICSASELSQALSSEGLDLTMPNASLIKVFLMNQQYMPLETSIQIKTP